MLKLYRPQRLLTFVLFINIIIGVFTSLNAQSWYNEDWGYRCEVTISNPGTTELTNYQVRINLDNTFSFANANDDGSDIRITAADGTSLLSFWIETWNEATTQATIWVELPLLPVGGIAVYLYYNNPAATSISDGLNTFHAYDGFETYTLGTTPTSPTGNPGEWDRYPGNPILVPGTSGSWDANGATFASVIYDDRVSEYRMYYHGYNSLHQVGLATSPDGISWTKYAGNPIVAVGPSGSWDRTGVRVPMVWKEGTNDYRMIYTGSGAASGQIGYATSPDGINWTKYAGNPVFNDPTWAHNQTENWGVMKVGSEYLMWYSTWGTRQSGIAVSTDLINWTPHTPGPIFATNGIPSDDRYSQFCPFSFKYNDDYYVLVPSYSSVGDYSKFYLYRSSSPFFPESDRTLVRIAHTPQGVDAHDNDTPFVLTLDIERSIFPNDELRVYYAADPGSGSWTWSECLLIEPDIADALSDAPLPTSANLTWTKLGTGPAIVVNSPVRQGSQSLRHTNFAPLQGDFSQLTHGIAGAWMRRSSTDLVNDYDIYLYDVTNTLNCVAGLGSNGFFHHWSGTFTSTGVSYSMDTWYLVTLEFNCTTNLYNFVVYNASMQEVVRRNAVSFGNVANSTAIHRGVLYPGGTFSGNAYADDYRVCKWAGTSTIIIGPPVALPVELSSFSASIIGSIVKLNWKTETEVSNYGFDIERKAGSRLSEVGNFEKIGFVQGNGNSNSPKYYSFENNILTTGKYSYRLKQIDTDGQFEYSKVIEVELGSPMKYELSQNYPNPFNPVTTIQFSIPEAGEVKLVVYNVLGEQVALLVNENKEAGVHTINFNASELNSGLYIYKINAGSFTDVKKLMVVK